MFTETFMVNDAQVAEFYSALQHLREFLGGVTYQIDHRIELTFSTEDKRLIYVVRALIGQKLDEFEPIDDQVLPIAGKTSAEQPEQPFPQAIIFAQPKEPTYSGEKHLPPGIKASQKIDKPAGGLVACNVAERSATCPNCQGSFIRRRRDQVYCEKPDCRKVAQREQNRKWLAKKNGKVAADALN